MFRFKINKIKLVGILYWLLLLYIITALLFWYIKLEHQHSELIEYQINQLHLTKKNNPIIIKEIQRNGYKKTMQYTGEGIVFLIIIFLVAIYIYKIIKYEWKFATQQKNLLTALSHELKTPISILQINIQTILKRELEKPVQQQLLLSMLEENKRLENISNNILLSNQLLSNNYVIFFDKINLSELIFKVIKRFSYNMDISNFTPSIENNLSILGDILLIEILINNLLDNAFKYGNNKPILIDLFSNNKKIFLKITNFGDIISTKEQKKIFQQFYRIGNEDTRKNKGTGLGLFICKKIVSQHHAQIKLISNIESGTIFTIIFKKII